MAKRKKPKFNNQYKIDNSRADEIRSLPNDKLVERASLEYCSWKETERLKKEDPEVAAVRAKLKDVTEAIKEDPQYVKAKEDFNAVVDTLIDESEATYKEELKNLMQPFSEDLKLFRGSCRLAWDEINARRLSGKLNDHS
jgi:predicted transcriptional regulator